MKTKASSAPSSLSPSSMSPADLLFGDLADEFAATRRVLERVPDGYTDWIPHKKSMPLGRLATHLSELPRFGLIILTTDELDWTTSDYIPVTLSSTAEILAQFDNLSAKMQAAIAKATWEDFSKEWTMRAGDHVFIRGNKGKLLRTVGLSHSAHHRAQLGVYLRLLDVPVPQVYGPSADES